MLLWGAIYFSYNFIGLLQLLQIKLIYGEITGVDTRPASLWSQTLNDSKQKTARNRYRKSIGKLYLFPTCNESIICWNDNIPIQMYRYVQCLALFNGIHHDTVEKGARRYLSIYCIRAPCSHRVEQSRHSPIWATFALFYVCAFQPYTESVSTWKIEQM